MYRIIRNARNVRSNHHAGPRNHGALKLSKAADEKVGEKSAEIAQSLLKGALDGNASATRLLVQLAEGADWVQDPQAVEQVLDVVGNWTSELSSGQQGKPAQLTAGGSVREGQLLLPAATD